ncbi:MAG: deoxyribonuclease IV [Ignavibacteria bacterium RBG_13_36_8]|nr:MAG: deoxyribonuclease IV [Ignavibacteria bacterium RBG_13_36_8]
MLQLIGAHTSISGGVATSVDRAVQLKFTAMQIFTKNNNQWYAKHLDEKEIESFKTKLSKSNIKFVQAHDSYLINLCAKDKVLLEKSRKSFIDELIRCEQLGILFLNFHPGAHGGQGEKEGLKIIAESINIAHEKTSNSRVSTMLETTAGQGTSLGYRFEHLAEIIDMVEDKSRMTVCIDTAHIYAAGYDLHDPKNYKRVIKEFDDIIGSDRLKAFHINDSKKELGSRVDRHEHIGKGFIGKEGFSNIMNDKKLVNIPKILETPKGKEQLEDIKNIKVLVGLIKK